MAGTISTKMELNGEQEYQRSLKEIVAESKSLSSQMKSLTSGFDENASAQDKARAKSEQLSKQIKVQEEYINRLNSDLKTMDANSAQAFNQQDKINKATTALNKMKQELQDIPNAAELAGQKIQSIGDKMQKVGSSMTKYVTAPLAAIGTASIAAWKEVDEAMDTVATKTGASGAALEEMQNSAKDIATTIPVSFQDAADSVGEVNTRFGVTGSELKKLSTQFSEFSQINNTDVSSSVDSVQRALSAYGLSAEDAGAMLDTLNTVGQNTGINVDKLADSMVTYGSQLRGFGMNASDAANLIGKLEKSGVDTSAVMTGLSRVQKNAMTDGVTMEQELQKALSSSSDAIDVFGSRAGPKLYEAFQNGLISVEDFQGGLSDLDDNLGNVENTFNETLDPIDQMKVDLNKLKEVGAEVGGSLLEALLPAVERAADGIEKFSSWFGSLSASQQDAVIKMGLFAAAAGPVTSALGNITSGVGKAVEGFGKFSTKVGGMSNYLTGDLSAALSTTTGKFGAVSAAASTFVTSFSLTSTILEVTGLNEKLEELGGHLYDVTHAGQIEAADKSSKALEHATQAMHGNYDVTLAVAELKSASADASDQEAASLWKLAQALNENKEAIENGTYAQEANKTATEETGAAAETSAEQVGTATGEMGEADQESADAVAEAEQQKQEAFQQTYESVQSSITQSVGMFDEMSTASDVTAQSILQAWDSQQQAFTNYKANFDTLRGVFAQLPADVQPAAQSFLSSVASMGTEGAQYIQALVQGIQSGDVTATQILSEFGEANNAKNIYANSMAAFVATTESGMSETNAALSSGMQQASATATEGGQQTANNYSSAVASGTSQALSAGTELSNSAGTGLEALDAMDAGNKIGRYYAAGIQNTVSLTSLSATNVANAGQKPLSAAGAGAYTWGAHLGQNFANGISSSAGAALAAARSIADQVSAILHHSTPDKGPLKHDDKWGAELGHNFAAGIEQSIPHVSHASNALANSVYDSVEKTKGSGKKKVAKTADEVESSFITAAEKRVKELKKADKISDTEVGQFWKSVANKCRKGSMAYSQAMQKVSETSDSIDSDIISSAKEALERQETYHGESLVQEVNYWNQIRKVLKDGTNARYEADKEYFNKKKELNSKLQDIEDDLASSIRKTYEGIRDSFGLFDDVEIENVSSVDLIDRERKQAAATQQYADALDQLSKKKLPPDLMAQLMETSVDDVGYLQKLLSYSDSQLDQYVKAWEAKSQAAAKAALLTTKNEQTSAVKSINDLMGTSEDAIKAGTDIGTKIVEGITKSFTTSKDKLIGTIYANFWKQAEDEAEEGVSSTTEVILPLIRDSVSTVMTTTGAGIADNAKAVTDEVKTVSDQSLETVSSAADETYSYGAEFGANMASGIRSQIAAVRAAAEELAAAAAGPVHHSTPDYGPLKGDDKWGAEMVHGFAASMLSRTGEVQKASLVVARAAAFSPTASAGMSGETARAVNYGGFEISVYAAPGQSADDIANAVASKIQKSIRRREAAG